ncbi:MAG: alpha/beta hydrolase family protein [Gemmatimonadales bacterium]
MSRWLTFTTVCLVMIPGRPSTGTAQAVTVPADSAGIAGWYDLGAAGRALVTWGARGGYRLLDFDSLHFLSLKSVDQDHYRTGGSGGWADAEVRFDRRTGQGAVAMSIRLPGGEELRGHRAREYPFEQEEVRYRSGSVTLGGLLMVPRVRKLVGRSSGTLHQVPIGLPAVVILHGSGDSDRDNIWAFTFAQSLARAGLVTLFADKRGCGASGGDWRTVGLDGLVDDALAGIEALRSDPRVDSTRVGLVGLSQGGMVAPLAAARSAHVAFVVSVSSAAVTLFDQMRHEMIQDLHRAGIPPEAIRAIEHVGALAVAYARTLSDDDWKRYQAARADLMSGPLAEAAAGFPESREDWHWQWWKSVGDVDPLPAWEAYSGPSLAIFGEDDEQDNVPVRESVQRLQEAIRPELHPEHLIRVYRGKGHTLADEDRGWVGLDVLADLDAWVLHAVGGLDPARTPQ